MTHEVIAQLKKAYYAGYEECEKGDANCFTGWREWASQLQSTQEGGTVEEVLDRIVVLPDHVKEDVLKAMSIVSATDKARIEELEKENANLKTVMIAAAEEIQEHWAAHCDEEGYGPVNLMHRLEKGIPSEYGYTAGRFDELKKEVERVGIMLVKAMGEVNDRDLEVERLEYNLKILKEHRGIA